MYQEWSNINLPDMNWIYQQIFVEDNRLYIFFGVIGNQDFELSFYKDYDSYDAMEKSFLAFRDFTDKKEIKETPPLFRNFRRASEKTECEARLNLIEKAIDGQLDLPDQGIGFYMVEKVDLEACRNSCLKELKDLEWSFLNLPDMPNIDQLIYVRGYRLFVEFGVIGNNDFEISYQKDYDSYDAMKKSFLEFISHIDKKAIPPHHSLLKDSNTEIVKVQLEAQLDLIEKAINGQLDLPDDGNGFYLMNNDLEYRRKWCREDLEKLA